MRQLALNLGIHFNTVAEAYRALAQEGFLEIVHGHGARVVDRQVVTKPGPEVADDFPAEVARVGGWDTGAGTKRKGGGNRVTTTGRGGGESMSGPQVFLYASAVLLPVLCATVWNWVPTRKQTRGNTFFGARVAQEISRLRRRHGDSPTVPAAAPGGMGAGVCGGCAC